MELLLVGDIGGTKTNLAIYNLEDYNRTRSDPIKFESFSSFQYKSLESIISNFIKLHKKKISYYVLAVAGPIINDKTSVTNLPWTIDKQGLIENYKIEDMHLMNDLESTAYFIPFLFPSELETIYKGNSIPFKNIAVIAPGTGLGQAFLTWNGSRYQPHATEGGHTDFSPTNEIQVSLLKEMQYQSRDRISVERVCSGIGIKNIYSFLKSKKHFKEEMWLQSKFKDTDPVPIILNTAIEYKGKSKLCDQVLDIFISILGTEVGNLALKVLALNGIYLAGGIPPNIIPALNSDNFINAVHNKGRLSNLMNQIPIKVIMNSNTALLGAVQYGYDNFSV